MDLPPDVVAQAIEFELTTIREVMAEETGVDFSDFTNTLSFCDIGVDSLLILSIIARIREVIDLQITPSFFVENNTLDEVRLALSDGTWRRQFALETHHSSRAVHSSEDNSRTLGIQCLLYRGVEDPNLWSASEFKSSKVECRGIQSYLKEPGPLGPSDHGGGFRIICRKQRSSLADPFWDAGLTLSELNITLGCPENYEYLSKHDAGVCGRFMTDRQHPGYVFLGPDITEESVKRAIETQFVSCPHPLILPTLMGELTAQDLMRKLSMIHKDLAIIENQTGYGDWKGQVGDATKHDCRAMARELGALSSRFAFVDVAIQCIITSAKFTLQEIDHMEHYLPENRSRQLCALGKSVKGRLHFLLSNLEHMKLFAGINHRMQAQQNVLFNLIAQQDNALNIEIARGSKELAAASKRDSSDMKIIAVLTTIFLPGTFIAAFFAMPLFNWNAVTMTSVMSDRLWVYWAVTGPLTIVTMGVVTVFAAMQKRQKTLDMRAARLSAGQGVV